MKKLLMGLLLALMTLPCSMAQTPTTATQYTVFGYHKLIPGKRDDFMKMAKAWKKIVASKKKAGKQEDWSIAEVCLTGSASEYNFVTRHSFVGEAQLASYLESPFLPEGWQSLVTPEEANLINHAYEIRTLVRQDVWSNVDAIMANDMDKSTVAVYNFFKQPAGKSIADHIKMENDIWKPVHAARIRDGNMKGWIFMQIEQPWGAVMPYDMITVDVFADMKQMLAPWFDTYFKKVHPGKEVSELMKQTNEQSNLLRTEIRIVIDRLDWPNK